MSDQQVTETQNPCIAGASEPSPEAHEPARLEPHDPDALDKHIAELQQMGAKL